MLRCPEIQIALRIVERDKRYLLDEVWDGVLVDIEHAATTAIFENQPMNVLPNNLMRSPKGAQTTKTIYVLTTGGTIEKAYSERSGTVQNLESKIDRYLALLRLPDCEVNVVPVMNKDSLEMTDQDRTILLGMVRAILKEKAPIVITHGTDTMVQTGLYLQQALPEAELPIVNRSDDTTWLRRERRTTEPHGKPAGSPNRKPRGIYRDAGALPPGPSGPKGSLPRSICQLLIFSSHASLTN
jgi:hypothetical protein